MYEYRTRYLYLRLDGWKHVPGKNDFYRKKHGPQACLYIQKHTLSHLTRPNSQRLTRQNSTRKGFVSMGACIEKPSGLALVPRALTAVDESGRKKNVKPHLHTHFKRWDAGTLVNEHRLSREWTGSGRLFFPLASHEKKGSRFALARLILLFGLNFWADWHTQRKGWLWKGLVEFFFFHNNRRISRRLHSPECW